MIVIKKYPNRRLYDTSRSSYVKLDDLAERVRHGEDIRVVDSRTGEDLTQEVLLQVVLEVLRGIDLLPVGMLRRIIRSSGTSPAHLLLRRQLSTGLDLMSTQLDNLEALMPFPTGTAAAAPAEGPVTPDVADAPDVGCAQVDGEADAADLEALRARLAELEARLVRRGG